MHVYEAAPKMDVTPLSVYMWIYDQDIIMAPQGCVICLFCPSSGRSNIKIQLTSMFDPQLVRFWGTMYMCLSHKSEANAVGEEHPCVERLKRCTVGEGIQDWLT